VVPAGVVWEVIWVDNGSTEETSEVCAAAAKASGGRIRWLFWPVQGYVQAANAGIRLSRGEIIAFVDDDVLPRGDWLVVMCQEFSDDPGLEAISGRVELWNPKDLPIAIRQLAERVQFSSLDHAFSLFIGCNMAVRHSLVERIGCYDLDLPGTGEDSEFCYRAWKAGSKLMYVPSLFVYHDHGRQTAEARREAQRRYIAARGSIYAKYILQRDPAITRALYWEIRAALRNLIQRKDDLAGRELVWLLGGFTSFLFRRFARLVSYQRKRTCLPAAGNPTAE